MNRPVKRLWRWALALLASVAALSLTAAAFGGSPRYQDFYGHDQPGQSSSCPLPGAQETGGWVCWSPVESGP